MSCDNGKKEEADNCWGVGGNLKIFTTIIAVYFLQCISFYKIKRS